MQLTEHIMSLHSGQKTFKCARLKKDEKVSNIKNSLEIYESSLKYICKHKCIAYVIHVCIILLYRSRLLIYDKNIELLSTSILKTYIAYARQYVHPFLNEEAKHEIRQFYLQLRKHKYEKQSNPITPRQLESLIRLSQVILFEFLLCFTCQRCKEVYIAMCENSYQFHIEVFFSNTSSLSFLGARQSRVTY